ncbi:methyl-accepting chemotaxis protein [Niveibacterium terrae]|uniref:methyl-accepting chemotaxis protein n=1 Tax=Niveibacterium terrae TaxID=3373598 RepID=UPI003A8EE2D6
MQSVQGRIALAAGSALVISSVVLLAINVGSSMMTQSMVSGRMNELIRNETEAKLSNLASAQAGAIQGRFALALDAARTMAHTFALSKGGLPMGRPQLNAILNNVLISNPEFNGTYSCWEPNAVDGADAQHASPGNGNNVRTGRFTPYWTRSESGAIAVQPLVEYDSDALHPNGVPKGGWYAGPKTTGKESVLGPLPYIVQGKNVFLATMSVPIVINGKFVGVAGADYNLDFVQKISEETNKSLYDGKGKLLIVSDRGLVVADSANPGLIGKSFNPEVGEQKASGLLEDIRAGKAKTWVDDASQTMNALAPISLGRTEKPWAVLIQVPREVVLAKVNELNHDVSARSVSTTVLQVGIGAGIIVLASLFLWRMAARIAKPIRDAAEIAQKIEYGIFDARLTVSSDDEVGKLASALNSMADSLQEKVNLAEQISEGNLDCSVKLTSPSDQLGKSLQKMVENLNRMIGNLQTEAGAIDKNAKDMSELSQELSEGACSSAASIEEISTAMAQISSQTKSNAENAVRAKTISQSSRTAAVTGAHDMSEMLSAMQEIKASGDNITTIIQTINDITKQTNLLALNAAIEAARAGESGAGFAVVADEVRSLATRSARAAQQVTQLVQSSSDKTAVGVDVANKTSESLKQIVTSAEELSQLVEDISLASQEQVIGIEEISKGMLQIDHATQAVSTHAERSASTAAQLTSQARLVHDLIKDYRVRQ